jgi:adenosylcobinamide-GDP ribazoletransferase
MGLVMAGLPNARGEGLSARHGQPGWAAAWAGMGLAFGVGLVAAGGAALWLVMAVGLMAAAAALVARAKIGGQTGDVLGATQVLAEVAALAVATAWLA